MLIVKIMSSDAMTLDDAPDKGHQIIANVSEVIFYENDPDHPGQVALAEIWQDGREESTTHPVHSCAYVMNEQGRTISRFNKTLPGPMGDKGWGGETNPNNWQMDKQR
jgi:hypothetical protein